MVDVKIVPFQSPICGSCLFYLEKAILLINSGQCFNPLYAGHIFSTPVHFRLYQPEFTGPFATYILQYILWKYKVCDNLNFFAWFPARSKFAKITKITKIYYFLILSLFWLFLSRRLSHLQNLEKSLNRTMKYLCYFPTSSSQPAVEI